MNNKYKLSVKDIINNVVILVIYLTWMISTMVFSKVMKIQQGNGFGYANVIGTIAALIYFFLYHYPLIPIFSKNINPRIEAQAVNVRRTYYMQALYVIVIGFFAMAVALQMKLYSSTDHKLASAFGVLELITGITMTLYACFTINYINKFKALIYVDKLQHKNSDIVEQINK